MKKILFAAVISAFAFGFSSCDKTDDTQESKLIGTWKYTYEYFQEGEEAAQEGEVEDDITMTFQKDGTGTWAYEDRTSDFTWELADDRLKLVYVDRGDSETHTVESITSTQLIISQTVPADVEYPDGYYVRQTWTKVK